MTNTEIERAFSAYVECALWSSTDTNENGDHINLDSVDAEIAPETLVTMREELTAFVPDEETAALLDGLEPEQIGHDFWLTRNHHGAGFWDRGLGARGDELTKACQPYGTADLYIGDDGLIYQS